MPTITRYVSRLLLLHLALLLTAFAAMLQLLDLLNQTDDILAKHGDRISALGTYILLRLPDIVSFILPFSVLIAALLTLARLARNNEVLAAKAGGMSYYRLLLAFAPGAMVIAVLHFALNDQLVPVAAHALQQWDARAAAKHLGSQRPVAPGIWLRDGSTIIRVEWVAKDGLEIDGITLFMRNEHAVLSERLVADKAIYDDAGWHLIDVRRFDIDAPGFGGLPVIAARMDWDTKLTPGHFANLAADPNSVSFSDLLRFVANPQVGAHPTDYYETWLQRKIAVPLTVLIMILLAAPVAQGFQRHGGMAAGLVAGVGLGFLYFIADGLLLTLGETGVVAPVIAAWGTPGLFAAVGIFGLLRIEGY